MVNREAMTRAMWNRHGRSSSSPNGASRTLLLTLALSSGLTGASTFTAAQAAAQGRDDAEATGSFACWHGAPPPTCGGFFIVEAQGVFPLVSSGRSFRIGNGHLIEQRAFESRLEWNLGYMTNVSPRWAVGGALSVGTGSYDALTGLRARVRRWLHPQLSLELQGGLVRTHAANVAGGVVDGVSADVRLNVRDHGSFFVRWDGVPVPQRLHWDGTLLPATFENALIVGVGTGSTWTVVGSGLLGLWYLAAIAGFATS